MANQVMDHDVRQQFLNKAVTAYEKDTGGHYTSPEREQIGEFIGSVVRGQIESGTLPIQSDSSEKPILLSVAANAGIMEKGIQSAVGEKMKVISGDLGVYKPREESTPAVQADARDLPFKDGAVMCIVDYLGAGWHDLTLDNYMVSKDLASSMFKRLGEKLADGGILIVDDQREGDKASTGELIDSVLKGGLQGFRLVDIQSDTKGHRIRIYKKEAVSSRQ